MALIKTEKAADRSPAGLSADAYRRRKQKEREEAEAAEEHY